MKKICAILLTMAIAMSAFSQPFNLKWSAASSETRFLKQLFQERGLRSGSWKWDTILCYSAKDSVYERLVQSFDPAGRAKDVLVQTYDLGWVSSVRNTYGYNSNNQIVTILNEVWQTTGWRNDSRLFVTYDTAGAIVIESLQVWYNNDWYNYLKRSYTYDATGRLSRMIQQYFYLGSWEYDFRMTYHYGGFSGNYTVDIEIPNASAGWNPAARYTFTNYINGNYLNGLYEVYQNGIWNYNTSMIYTYDEAGNFIEELDKLYSGGEWEDNTRSFYSYDLNGNGITGKNEKWQYGNWVPVMQTSYVYNQNGIICTIDDPVYRYEANYRLVAGIEDKTAENINISPNPAEDHFHVSGNKNNLIVSIFNAEGVIVKESVIKGNEEIKVNDLQPGIYLVEVGNLGFKKLLITNY